MPPDRALAQRRNEGDVRLAFVRGQARRERLRPQADERGSGLHAHGGAAGFDQNELRLPGADQFNIDLGQDFGIEQRAVLGAPGIVYPVTPAEVVETVGPAWMLAARQQQRIDESLARDQRLAGAIELGIEEAEVEHCVVRDQRRIGR